MSVIDALDDLILQPFFDVRPAGLQARNAVDYIDSQVKTIDLIVDGTLERSVDVAFLFIPTHMNVLVIGAAITELVDE